MNYITMTLKLIGLPIQILLRVIGLLFVYFIYLFSNKTWKQFTTVKIKSGNVIQEGANNLGESIVKSIEYLIKTLRE